MTSANGKLEREKAIAETLLEQARSQIKESQEELKKYKDSESLSLASKVRFIIILTNVSYYLFIFSTTFQLVLYCR